MGSYDNADESVPVAQLNSELVHAQLELLSAHCASHQLRLRYSSADLARFGCRDVLRKSAEAANALNEFYSAIERKLPPALPEVVPSTQPTAEQIAQAAGWVSTYLRAERERYFPQAGPLSNQCKALMWPYFSSELLNQVGVVELRGARVTAPEFFAQARALGFEPPSVTHMDSLTFVDVVVFNEEISERSLFHALVHSVQIQILGLDRYAELWVNSFAKTRTHFTVPLEVHAFSLASKFVRPVPERFSVEDHVLRWVIDERY